MSETDKEKGISPQFSIQRLAYFQVIIGLTLLVLYLGYSFFVPLVYGIFFAFMLKPIRDRIEVYIDNRVVAILLTLLSVFAIIVAVFGFFIVEISGVLAEADGVVISIQDKLYVAVGWAGEMVGYSKSEAHEMFTESFTEATEVPIRILTTGLGFSGTLIATVSLIVIYTFFMLLYSTALKRFILGQMTRNLKREGESAIREIQTVATSYLSGMLIVMLVLGVLNSLGLWALGVRFALVWGFLGALLAVIPYIGTFIGGALPFIYSLATSDSLWQPIAVIVLYMTIQSLEGNIITPKVVGNSVRINALAAILSLIFGAMFWGVAGVILAIPMLAMLRVVMEHIDSTKPLALLLSDDLYDKSELFVTKYNRDKYRLRKLFRFKKVIQVDTTTPLVNEVAKKIGQSNPKVVTDSESE